MSAASIAQDAVVTKICGLIGAAARTSATATKFVDAKDDSRGGIHVLSANVPLAARATVTLSMRAWQDIVAQAPQRVKGIYWSCHAASDVAAFEIDMTESDMPDIAASGADGGPMPLFVATRFPVASMPHEDHWAYMRPVARTDAQCALAIAATHEIGSKLLGWLCVRPTGRTTDLPSNQIVFRAYEHLPGGTSEDMLLLAIVKMVSADGVYAITHRLAEHIAAIGRGSRVIDLVDVVVQRTRVERDTRDTLVLRIAIRRVLDDNTTWDAYIPKRTVLHAPPPDMTDGRRAHKRTRTVAFESDSEDLDDRTNRQYPRHV